MHKQFLAAVSLIALASTPAWAQPAPAEPEVQDGIADIVVTAQRRRESVQDVPIAISAFSGDQLRAQGVSNTLELGQFVPNLVAQNNTGLGSANAYYIRGLGNTETIATFDPPVGTYVDDIYLSRQNANNLSLFDVERVEVLRGPQGTLFGRNTTGGAINVILREPGEDFGGYAEVGYGRFDKKLVRASVDVPLADSLAVKVSGYFQDDDGYAKNITTGERANDDDGWGARLGVRGELSDSVRWTGSYARIIANGENLLNQECDPRNNGDCDGRFVSTGLRKGNEISPSPYLPLVISGRKANYGLGNRTASDLVTSNLEFGLGDDLSLNLITGFVNQIQQYSIDFSDGRALPSLANPNPAVRGDTRGGFTILNDGQNDQFSQEVKLSGKVSIFDFVGGFYYLKENNRTDFADLFTVAPNTTIILGDRTLTNSTKAYAGYFQADANLTDQIKLTAGIRYTDEEKKFSIFDNRASCNDGSIEANCLSNQNLTGPSGVAIPRSQRAKVWTPRFAANFKVDENILFFASATRGFKSGGWNARGTAASQLLPFGPEKIWSYEAGLKSDLFNRRVRANLTFFYADVTNLQTPSALVAANGSITFLTRNFADYRNKGVEAEFTFQPVDGLNLYANFGYQDDKYIIDRSAPAADIYGIQSVAAQQAACQAALAAGKIAGGANVPATLPSIAACASGIITPNGSIATPVRTPKFSLAIGGSYEIPLGSLSLVPSVNGSFRSKQEVQTSNYTIYSGSVTGTNGTFPANPTAGQALQGSFSEAAWLVNAGIALNGPDKAWQLSVNCTNCLNETFVQSALANTTYLNQPMMWQVRARVSF
ncbi:TonB-dependent receptor [Glacieibacterium frigidum]|uniref:TonB-dependent receptor n=1 Tax=Glacieibacterium frigidum TaxID=2593303 RepID=A0A552UII0_9SPHN|nr:TonB-dependent receptor [Glacieibacterium frigidum]TRW18029.1 TonB-dependent receptor [Glacieibacterium frigidum]